MVSIHKLMAVSPQHLCARFYALWEDIFDTPLPDEEQTRRRFCELAEEDIDVLLARGVIEEAPQHCDTNTSMFRIDEPEKKRARIITWTQRVNDIKYEASAELNITDPFKVILLADGMHSAVVADLRAAFYQIEIPAYARHRFVFEFRGTKYQFTRLPMGARQSAEMCAIYLQCLTWQALTRCDETSLFNRSVFGRRAGPGLLVSRLAAGRSPAIPSPRHSWPRSTDPNPEVLEYAPAICHVCQAWSSRLPPSRRLRWKSCECRRL